MNNIESGPKNELVETGTTPETSYTPEEVHLREQFTSNMRANGFSDDEIAANLDRLVADEIATQTVADRRDFEKDPI